MKHERHYTPEMREAALAYYRDLDRISKLILEEVHDAPIEGFDAPHYTAKPRSLV